MITQRFLLFLLLLLFLVIIYPYLFITIDGKDFYITFFGKKYLIPALCGLNPEPVKPDVTVVLIVISFCCYCFLYVNKFDLSRKYPSGLILAKEKFSRDSGVRINIC